MNIIKSVNSELCEEMQYVVHKSGLKVYVFPKKGFNKYYAIYGTEYGSLNNTFTVPGDGVIDFKPIFDVLEKTGYEGYVLVEAEQDPAIANPLEYAIKARKYIAEKAGL